MELIEEFNYRVKLRKPLEIGVGTYGKRIYYEVSDGEIKGGRLNGKLAAGGSDWMIDEANGWWRPDVRIVIKTEDDAFIAMSYDGFVEVNEKFQRAVAESSGTLYEDHYMRIRPRMETGDLRYGWVNHTVFIGEGRIVGPFEIEYSVCRIT